MAYDEEFANRVREQVADEDGVTEKAMFGGLAFLLKGWVLVAPEGVGHKRQLGAWVARGMRIARTIPPKG
jgi:hypothetical protein